MRARGPALKAHLDPVDRGTVLTKPPTPRGDLSHAPLKPVCEATSCREVFLKVAERRTRLHLGVSFEVFVDEPPQHHIGREPEVR